MSEKILKLMVLGPHPSIFTKFYTGPMRVVYNLCRVWKLAHGVKLSVLSIKPSPLFRYLFGDRFRRSRTSLIVARARYLLSSDNSRPDVINVHCISRAGVELAKLSRQRGIPIVYTAHGAAFRERELGSNYSDDFIRWEKFLVSFADKVVVVSPEQKKLLVSEYELPDKKVAVIYNGVDANFGRKKYRYVNVRKKYSIPNERKILLNIGGTRKVKDIPFLIKALELVGRDDWHLILAGSEGEEHEAVMRECASRLGKQYTFVGKKSQNELLNLYHQSHLLVATSKYEAFGLTPLEALSCGTEALVRSTIPGSRYYFYNNPSLIERSVFDSPKELANIIENRLEAGSKVESEYIKRLLQYHSWENRAKEYLDIFEQLMKE